MYIRTKNEIRRTDGLTLAEDERFGKRYLNEYNFPYIPLKEADTIEELCDEFVIEYVDGSKIISIHDNTDDFLREHKDEIESGYIKNVYGAIWVDGKGLIYVAKMNSKGDLELI